MKTTKINIMILLLLLGACAKKDANTLVIGMELAYAPFETKDQNGKPIGVSVDLAKELGAYLGKNVVIENIAWSGLIPALQTGKIDLILSSLTITEDRKKQIDFSDPYAKASLGILANINAPIESIEDLNKQGIVIAVKQGSTPSLYASKNLTNATINSFTSTGASLTEVIQGKADATLFDQLTVYKNHIANPTTTKIIPATLQPTDKEEWGIGVKKGREELVTNINQFLKEFEEKNGFKMITDKHLDVEKKDFDKYGLEFFF